MANSDLQLSSLVASVNVDSRLQVAEVAAESSSPGTRMQLAELAAIISSESNNRVQMSELEVSVRLGNRVQLADIAASAVVGTTLDARMGPGQLVQPFMDVLVDGSLSTGTIVSYLLEQLPTGGPTIGVLPSTQPTITYRPPPALNSYTVQIRLTVKSTTQTSIVTRTDTVLPCENWTAETGVWTPAPQYNLESVYVVPELPPLVAVSGSFSSALGAAITLTMSADDTDGTVMAWKWKPLSWPGAAVAPILLTPDQPTTSTLPLTVAGTYLFQATATDNTGKTSIPATVTVTVT